MNAMLHWVTRSVVLAVVLIAGTVLSGLVLRPTEMPSAPDGPLSVGQAVLIISVVEALLLSRLAMGMSLRGWRLGMVLAATLFGIETGLSMIEAAFFNADLHLPAATLWMLTLMALLRDGLAGITIGYLWRGAASAAPTTFRGLPWKVPAIALLYVVAYFLAGALIAWQSPTVRAFYANIHQISLGSLALLQVGRGLVWTGLVLLVLRCLQGAALHKAMLIGVTLALLMSLQLLYPNAAMPWPVRSVHIIEIAVSNLAFGILAAVILLSGARIQSARN